VYYRDLIDRLKPDCLIYYTGEMRDPADVPRLVWARLEKNYDRPSAETALSSPGDQRRNGAVGPQIPLVEAWLTTANRPGICGNLIAERRYEPASSIFPAEASEIETSQTWTILKLFIRKGAGQRR
jgi:hypothetical protein